MDDISGFLQKFLKLDKENKLKIRLILDAIKERTNLELKSENLEIKGDNLKIKSTPLMRNEIFMHKEEIESSLKSQKIYLKLV